MEDPRHVEVLSHPVAVPPDVDDVAVVQEPVQERRRVSTTSTNSARASSHSRAVIVPRSRFMDSPVTSKDLDNCSSRASLHANQAALQLGTLPPADNASAGSA